MSEWHQHVSRASAEMKETVVVESNSANQYSKSPVQVLVGVKTYCLAQQNALLPVEGLER